MPAVLPCTAGPWVLRVRLSSPCDQCLLGKLSREGQESGSELSPEQASPESPMPLQFLTRCSGHGEGSASLEVDGGYPDCNPGSGGLR